MLKVGFGLPDSFPSDNFHRVDLRDLQLIAVASLSTLFQSIPIILDERDSVVLPCTHHHNEYYTSTLDDQAFLLGTLEVVVHKLPNTLSCK